jgi:hypothetical protein
MKTAGTIILGILGGFVVITLLAALAMALYG